MRGAKFTQARQPRSCKSKLFPDAATIFCNIIEAGGNRISPFYKSIVVDIKNLSKGTEAIPSSSLDKKSVGWKTENYMLMRFIIRRSSHGSIRAIKSGWCERNRGRSK
jgi:hypothetical protein